MKRIFDIVHKAQSAALAAAKPGVEAQSVDAAARNVVNDAGYGPNYNHFTHRVGHGIGMDGHEWPYLVRGNTLKLASNMTFSDEPGIYIRGEFGVRLEDDMRITENGAELFTPQSPSLEHPFGVERQKKTTKLASMRERSVCIARPRARFFSSSSCFAFCLFPFAFAPNADHPRDLQTLCPRRFLSVCPAAACERLLAPSNLRLLR
jgi:hypothetical protein